MRKKSFKLLGTLCFALVAALMISLSGNIAALAADDNDTFVNAVSFSSKKPVEDMIENKDDIDWFSYTIDTDCGIYFSLTNLEVTGGEWRWEMYDEKAQNVLWSTTTSEGTFVNDSPLMCFEKGTKLLFKISKPYYNSCLQKRFRLSSNIDDKENWEKEDNGSFSRATEIFDKKTTVGVLNFASDTDWYQYTVTDTNPFQIVLTNTDKNGGEWNIIIYDEDATTELWNKTSSENTFVTETQRFMYDIGHKLFIKIAKPYYNSGLNKKYQLSTKYDSTDGWGAELNDTYSTAVPISSADAVKGIIASGADVDWYVYTVPNNKEFYFELTNTEKNGGEWRFEIIDGNTNNAVWSKTTAESSFVTTSDKLKYKAGDIIYVKLTKPYYNSCLDKTYQLKVYDSADNKKISKPEKPISVLAKTNVVVGKATPGATVYVQYNKKKYSGKADADGYYRIATATLKKGDKVQIWQKVGKKTSDKLAVKVVAGY
ncbi:MAG: hypothetical protein K6E85_14275 [Lachnospiraceae bacterium]|nr:hypothetical protein [Lachnospiraceae bacterium]